MKEIAKLVKEFTDHLKHTAEYRLYEEKRDKVKLHPGLQEEINKFRKDVFTLQQLDGGELFEKADGFLTQYEGFRSNPVVDEYLTAELAVCRMMQNVYLQIADAIDLDIYEGRPQM